MQYREFSLIFSTPRMNRYLHACRNSTKRAMTLYRRNLKLSQELFTIISCFEIALRNKIDSECCSNFGNDWLRDAASNGGVLNNRSCQKTSVIINQAVRNLRPYSHNKVVAELGFGLWRYMFAQPQFTAMGRCLLRIFPLKPRSTQAMQYNNSYVFNQLASINELRNRIAHHEPICFTQGTNTINTNYARDNYHRIIELFNWMDINHRSLLYGIDHVETICDQIDQI